MTEQAFEYDRYLIEQLVRPMVKLYRVTPLAAGETLAGPPVAFARQKRMAFSAWGNPWFPHEPPPSWRRLASVVSGAALSSERPQNLRRHRGSRRAKPGSAGDSYLSVG